MPHRRRDFRLRRQEAATHLDGIEPGPITRTGLKLESGCDLFKITGALPTGCFQAQRSELEPDEVLLQKPFAPEGLVGRVREILYA